jgi:hypothetical protein
MSFIYILSSIIAYSMEADIPYLAEVMGRFGRFMNGERPGKLIVRRALWLKRLGVIPWAQGSHGSRWLRLTSGSALDTIPTSPHPSFYVNVPVENLWTTITLT